MNIGDSVVVYPKFDDVFDFEFLGTVESVNDDDGTVTVRDQSDDCFTVDEDQVELADES